MHDYQLQSFLTAARLGSFNSASKEEHLAVQTFALRIKTLEQELGFPLFNRTAKGVELTREGEEYLTTAESVLEMLRAGQSRAKHAKDQAKECISIGYPWRITQVEQAIFVAFQRNHSNVVFEYIPTPLNELLDDLVQGRVDVTVLPSVIEASVEGIRSFPADSKSIMLAVRPQHPLASEEYVDPRALEGMTVLFGYDYRKDPRLRWMETYFPKDCVKTRSLPGETVVMKCLESDSYAALSGEGSYGSMMCPPLVRVPLLDSPVVTCSVCFRSNAPAIVEEFARHYAESL